MNIVRAERVDFQIAPGIFLEFYRLPDGEKRIGKTSAAIVCGHSKQFFNRLQESTPKQAKALQGRGFTGCTKSVMVAERGAGVRGASRSDTLSLDDFRAFVRFSAFDAGKKPAMAIADALMGVAIETIARQAFGEAMMTLEEIRRAICSEYAKTVAWLKEDAEDVAAIDEHLLFLQVG